MSQSNSRNLSPACRPLGNVGVLQENRALKVFAAMQSGTQNEMALEQGAGFAEKGEQVFAHPEVSALFRSPSPITAMTSISTSRALG